MLIVAPLGGWGDRASPLGGSAELWVPWYLQGWVLGPAWPREPFLRISAGCSPVPCILLLESSVPGGGVALRAVAGSPALPGPSQEGLQVLSQVLWGACAVPGALLSGAYYLVYPDRPQRMVISPVWMKGRLDAQLCGQGCTMIGGAGVWTSRACVRTCAPIASIPETGVTRDDSSS